MKLRSVMAGMLVAVCIAIVAGAADKTEDARLTDLGFLTGTWIRHEGNDELEETWLPPRGDCMLGVFRWIKDGKVWMYELMTISAEKEGLVFRIRHFDKAQKPWEESPLVYELKKIEKNQVVFEHDYAKHADRFVFSRPDDETYVVGLHELGVSGKKPQEFSFKREK
jgi:hypothetical protein